MSETNATQTNASNIGGNNQTGRSSGFAAAIPLDDDRLRQVCGGSEQTSRATGGAVKYITDSIE